MNTLTPEQQRDMRGILKILHAFYKKTAPDLFKTSQVIVTPKIASIVVELGVPPKNDGDKNAAIYYERQSKTQLVFTDFNREQLYRIGSPIMQAVAVEGDGTTARYKIIPDDPVGAERGLKKLIARIEKSK